VADPSAPLRVRRGLTLPAEELEWSFSGSGGPGGQHANTANTRVTLRFDIVASRALGPRQRQRLLERLGPVVRVVASDERSQLRNRELARERLAARLAAALVTETRRVPTRPGKGAVERRLQEKRALASRKRDRRPPGADD